MINAIIIRLWIDLIYLLFNEYEYKVLINCKVLIDKFVLDNKLRANSRLINILFTELLFNQFGKKRVDTLKVIYVNHNKSDYSANQFYYITFDSYKPDYRNGEILIGNIKRKHCYAGRGWIFYRADILYDLLADSFSQYYEIQKRHELVNKMMDKVKTRVTGRFLRANGLG